MTSETQVKAVILARLKELAVEMDSLDLRLVGAKLMVSGAMALIAKNVPLEIIQNQLRDTYDQLRTAKTFVDSLIRSS